MTAPQRQLVLLYTASQNKCKAISNTIYTVDNTSKDTTEVMATYATSEKEKMIKNIRNESIIGTIAIVILAVIEFAGTFEVYYRGCYGVCHCICCEDGNQVTYWLIHLWIIASKI